MPPPPLFNDILLLGLFVLLLPPSAANTQLHHHTSSFSLDFFTGAGDDGAAAQLVLSAAANATTSGAISMRSPHAVVQYRNPIHLTAHGFSTYFSFSLRPTPTPNSSFAFFLTPAAAPKTSAAVLLAVVFFFANADHPHIRVRIELAGDTAVQTGARGIHFSRDRKLYSWIDYNATSAELQVRLSASRVPKPPRALLSYHLSTLSRGSSDNNPMLAGFVSETTNCTLFSWAFRAADLHSLTHSLPLDPTGLLTTPPTPVRLHSDHDTPPRYGYRYPSWVSLLFAAACGAMLTFFLLFAWYSVGARRRPVAVAPVDHPSDVVYEKIVLVGIKDVASAASNK